MENALSLPLKVAYSQIFFYFDSNLYSAEDFSFSGKCSEECSQSETLSQNKLPLGEGQQTISFCLDKVCCDLATTFYKKNVAIFVWIKNES